MAKRSYGKKERRLKGYSVIAAIAAVVSIMPTVAIADENIKDSNKNIISQKSEEQELEESTNEEIQQKVEENIDMKSDSENDEGVEFFHNESNKEENNHESEMDIEDVNVHIKYSIDEKSENVIDENIQIDEKSKDNESKEIQENVIDNYGEEIEGIEDKKNYIEDIETLLDNDKENFEIAQNYIKKVSSIDKDNLSALANAYVKAKTKYNEAVLEGNELQIWILYADVENTYTAFVKVYEEVMEIMNLYEDLDEINKDFVVGIYEDIYGFISEIERTVMRVEQTVMPLNVTEKGYSCDNEVLTITSDDGLNNWKRDGKPGKDNIKEAIIQGKVTKIGEYEFYGCQLLESVTLKEGVKLIENNAFVGCESLKNIILPSSVISIGEKAFYYCKFLENITLREGLKSIGSNAFAGCGSLKNIVFPDSVTSLGDEIFWDCKSLKSVTLSKNLESIPAYAFYGCKSLENVILKDGLKSIESNAFAGCELLKDITLPDSVTSIGEMAFYYCKSIDDITLKENVQLIGKEAFAGCESLKDIILPDSVTSIGDNVFYGCYKLETAVVHKDLTDDSLGKINSKCIIKYDEVGESIEITDITLRDDVKEIIIPSYLYGKPVTSISKSALEVIKNNISKVRVDSQNILNLLKAAGIDLEEINITCDKSELKKYYNENSSYKESEYIESTFKEYKEALTEAEKVINDKYSTQDECNKALENLQKAVDNLKRVDKTKLREIYEKYKDVAKGNYTDESYNEFKEALKTAENVINNGNAEQEEIDRAVSKLKNAADKLKVKADKTELKKIYEKYKDVAKGNYTDESYNEFKETLKTAENVINDENAKQEEIDITALKLQNTVDGLKKKSNSSNSSSHQHSSSS